MKRKYKDKLREKIVFKLFPVVYVLINKDRFVLMPFIAFSDKEAVKRALKLLDFKGKSSEWVFDELVLFNLFKRKRVKTWE